MDRQQLRDLLARLHQELATARSVKDDEVGGLLHQVVDDIHRVLDDGQEPSAGDAPADTPEEGETLVDRLRDAALEFEGAHPKLTAAVEEIANALNKAGI